MPYPNQTKVSPQLQNKLIISTTVVAFHSTFHWRNKNRHIQCANDIKGVPPPKFIHSYFHFSRFFNDSSPLHAFVCTRSINLIVGFYVVSSNFDLPQRIQLFVWLIYYYFFAALLVSEITILSIIFWYFIIHTNLVSA